MPRRYVGYGNTVVRSKERRVILRKRSVRDILLTWTMMLTVICRMPMIEAGNEPQADELHFQSDEPIYRPGEA